MIDWMLRRRGFVLTVAGLVIALCGAGASRLAIDPNNRVFFGEGHAAFRDLLEFEARFGSNTNLVFLVSADESMFESARLAEVTRVLHDELGGLPGVVSVDSLVNFPHVVDDGSSLNVFGALDYVCGSAGACDLDRADVLFKPHIVNRYIASDGRSLAVIASVDLFDPTPEQVGLIASSAKTLVDQIEAANPEIEVSLTGGVPMMDAFFIAAQNDASTLMVWVVAILALCLYLFLGGIVPAVVMILLGAGSVAATMGIAGWIGLVLNTATATVPLIVFTLVVAASMHVFLHIVREERLSDKQSLIAAARASLSSNWRPVLLTGLTTTVGLLSMVFVSAPPLRELGLLSATGVVIGTLLTLTAVPCAFACLSNVRSSNYLLGLQSMMNTYAKWIEHTRPSMAAVALLMIVALMGLFRLTVDEDFVRYFSTDLEFRTDTEEITKRLAGPYHVEFVYDSGDGAGVYAADVIESLSDLTTYLRGQDGVVNVASFVDVLQEVAVAMGDDRSLADIESAQLAEYFLSYELALNAGQSVTDLLDMGQQFARVSVLLGDVSMGRIRALVEDAQGWSDEQGFGGKLTISGEGVPTAYLSSESIREMATGIALSVLISAFIVGLYFRNAKAWLSILAATGIPILAGFGVWGWTGSEIGMAATLVVAITIGVVIDDTIHLTYRYVDSLRNLDLTPWGATAYSVHKTGTAILVTSIVLVAGLLVLVLSDFRMNSVFGVCSSLIILLALLYNLTLAPRLLSQLR